MHDCGPVPPITGISLTGGTLNPYQLSTRIIINHRWLLHRRINIEDD